MPRVTGGGFVLLPGEARRIELGGFGMTVLGPPPPGYLDASAR
ncbi:MAG TPA: hypothetical protein VFK54_00655 [Candidatus Limnocylindrales bacterium]|nr:hypothetical protein [Candidatus Limnocylindrales bacterium]